MKKYLGYICILYTGIIIYVKLSNNLRNFLAPQMQNYLLYASIPLLITGIVLITSEHSHYKFKITDLVLLLPLIMIIFAGDGRLTTTLARNKSLSNKGQIEKKNTKVKDDGINIKDYDMSFIDFDIIDDNYSSLIDYFSGEPKAKTYVGKTIRLRGFAVKKDDYLPKGYFFLGKYSISCCVADAGYLGIMAKYDLKKVKENSWYEIEGVLRHGKTAQGMDTMYVHVVNIRKISKSSEEMYVYPCYNYGDGNCEEVTKYDLKYY